MDGQQKFNRTSSKPKENFHFHFAHSLIRSQDQDNGNGTRLTAGKDLKQQVVPHIDQSRKRKAPVQAVNVEALVLA